PEFLGVRVLSSDRAKTPKPGIVPAGPTHSPNPDSVIPLPVSLAELVPFIDWSPFFHTWELRGRYPAILEKPEAKKLFDDAQQLLAEIVREKSFTARAVYGFFPANAVGDDIELYTDESRTQVLATLHFLRQQMDKPPDQFNHCLAD